MRNHKRDSLPSEIDDDENTLAYFGIVDGCEILVNERDLLEKNQTAHDNIEERIIEQELRGDIIRDAIQRQMDVPRI